jgi:protein O-mannosyl-transferase
MSAAQRLRRDPGLLCVVLAMIAVVALYGPTLGRGIVNYDDTWLIRDNWVVQDASWSSIKTILFDLHSPARLTLSPEYLPVRDFSILLDFAIWGRWYGGFHLTSLVLYLAGIWVWFRVLVGYGIDRRIAGLALLLWALHPAHAESVAWLSERKGLLAVLFTGLCGVAYTRFRIGRSTAWIVCAALFAVLAVWSKATAAFALAGLAGLDVMLPEGDKSRRALGLAIVGAFAAAAFIPVLLLATSSNVVGTEMAAPAGRGEMVVGVLGFYMRLGLMTLHNSVSYPITQQGPSIVDLVAGVVALVALGWALLVPRRIRYAAPPELRAAAVFFVACWLPVSHLILPLQMVFVADRYLLFPSLAIALAVAYGIFRVPTPRARVALSTALVLASALRTLDAQSTWRDDMTLWQRAVETNPRDGNAWSMYADAVLDEGRTDLAFDVISQGLRKTRSPKLLLRKALLVKLTGSRSSAIRAMREAAIAGEPKAMMNVGLMLLDAGQGDEAMLWTMLGARLVPLHAPARRAYGKVALAMHHDAIALTEFTAAYDLEPKNLANRYNLALALLAKGRVAEARPHLRACLADPDLGPRARALLGP